VIAKSPDDAASAEMVDTPDIPDGYAGVDIGPATIQRFTAGTVNAGAIFWNGPLGVFEVAAFADGTKEVARAIAESGAVTVAGGGETVQAARQFGVAERLSHLSTGGGASLKYLEGKPLPAIEVLDRK
jgi:phosphoglycerate kinase